ncbi:MAG: hypothetical protein EOR13_29330, partial [Mesorhizobium sp.]
MSIDEKVARSELANASRNAALAHFMKAHGNIENDVERLSTNCHQCAVAMNCVQLAAAGRFLAFDGPCAGAGRHDRVKNQDETLEFTDVDVRPLRWPGRAMSRCLHINALRPAAADV